jgi:SAM-dependent methyltransferase
VIEVDRLLQNEEILSGERLYLQHARSEVDAAAHLERYAFALTQIEPGQVILDAACGSGFGTEILAQKAMRVIGLELNDHALEYARHYHGHERVEFRKADLNRVIDLPAESFDTIVSFETLEHIQNQGLLLAEFRRVLKSGGRLILSTPDRDLYTDKAHSDNPFHISELSKEELLALVGRYFDPLELYGQGKYASGAAKLARLLGRLDVFGIRPVVERRLRHSRRFGKSLLQSRLDKLDFNEPNHSYFYLLLTAARS